MAEFRVLGSVELHVGGDVVDLGPARQRCVLAVLLVEANTTVPAEQLIDRVWGERVPSRVRGALHSYLARLRRVLAPEWATITRRTGGYVLTVDEETVDLHRFRRLIGQARAAVDDEQALAMGEQALGLWRGEPFTGLDSPWLASVRATLEREHFDVRLDHYDRRLRVGGHAALLPVLRAEVGRNPLDERLAGQLALALYRGGRQAEALEVFQEVRRRLVAEVGIEPGPDLQRLQERILRADRDLVAAHRPDVRRHNDLPGDLPDFTGRDAEVDALLSVLPAGGDRRTAAVVVAIDGMAGVGKTAFAVHVAHRLADRHPDAQLFLDLHAHTSGREPRDPADALDVLLRGLGVPGRRIPDDPEARASLWRSVLADRKALVVLDNAVNVAQVRPLLPGNPACLVLITSRHRLIDLDSTRTLSLDVLPPGDAATLFTRVVGGDHAVAAVDEVVRLCGRLPLAVRIAAARLRSRPAWTAAHLAQRLREEHRRLGELTTGDRSVVAAFSLSHRYLKPAHQRLFRLLGTLPGVDFDAHLAAAVADSDFHEAERLLEDLLDVHLLQQRSAGRYRFHDLLRSYAARLSADTDHPDVRNAALTRVLAYYLHTSAAAMDVIATDKRGTRPDAPMPATPVPSVSNLEQALSWLEAERPNLVAVAVHSADHGHPTQANHLSATLWRFLLVGGYFDDALVLHTVAVTTARSTGDRFREGEAHLNIGLTYWRLGRSKHALTHLERALALAEDLDDDALLGRVLVGLGLAHWGSGRYREALGCYSRGLVLARRIGDRNLEGQALVGTGFNYWGLGRFQESIDHHRQAIESAQDAGDRGLEGYPLVGMGFAHWSLGRYQEALDHHQRGLRLAREVGDRSLEGRALHGLGSTCRSLGRHHDALDHDLRALRVGREAGDRSLEGRALHGLGSTCRSLGRHHDALGYFEQALSLARAIDSHNLETEALNGLGETTRATADPVAALSHHRRALALARETGNQAEQVRAHEGIAHAHSDLGQAEEADRHRREAAAIHRDIGGSTSR
ncbi:AfsR/SARP family transcriptional regulator [Saccharothrix obliqua]|uniref:AfsR/SARP family transcriptional regulator n=1 Tax=Saccharothrix obliqua TaxID=2861747 RepID=UPI001C601C62|nr:tetratricopeptide repeat protein [Saccharothrix obliqua]MBW4717880.1 tetratricopeptide repeat protein [Saccharothrix obliqua]